MTRHGRHPTMTARARMLAGLRIAAVVLVTVGAVLTAARLVMAISLQDLYTFGGFYEGIGALHPMYNGVAMIIVGVPLGLLSRPLARWAIRPPDAGCPGCGYATSPGMARCPECGQAVAPDAPDANAPVDEGKPTRGG